MPAVVGGSLLTDTKRARGTGLDESTVLFSRGTLCRENPMSARGMKQGLRVIQGVNRYEVEKTCKRNVSGEANPG
jgi:hypothetical protein